MTQKEFKNVLLTEENVWVTLKNLQRYKTQSDTYLSTKLQQTNFNADQIIESETKKFVSQTEKDNYADKYTKNEIDTKLTEVISGLAFKGTFNEPTDLPKEGCKDGWLAIVVNDPEAQGKNVLYIYETAEIQTFKGEKAAVNGKWVKLNDLMIPGLATEETDGLMSKEDKTKLDNMESTIDGKIKPVTDKLNEIETAYKAEIKKVDDKINAMDAAYKAKGAELDGKITTLTEAHTNDKAALDKKIQNVDAKFVAASEQEIDALFA